MMSDRILTPLRKVKLDRREKGTRDGNVGRRRVRVQKKRDEEPSLPTPSCPRVSFRYTFLEHELQSELDDPRIAEARVGTRDNAEIAAAAVSVRDVEVHLVEDVEELRPELHVHVRAHAEVLEQPHVPAVQRRSV